MKKVCSYCNESMFLELAVKYRNGLYHTDCVRLLYNKIGQDIYPHICSAKICLLYLLNIESIQIDDCYIYLDSKGNPSRGHYPYKGTRNVVAKQSFRHVFGEPKNYVLHTCDEGPCWNPKHLYDGTAQQNVRDMYNKIYR